jgi:hypothetical protein
MCLCNAIFKGRGLNKELKIMPLTRVGKWSALYGLVALEVALISGTYYIWHNMNTSQNYRKKMYDKHPTLLEGTGI